jgi:hypothetical protein
MFDVMDADAMLAKMLHHRGPGPGEGRSHGRPWRGIVEETPCLWVTWLVTAAKRLGAPVPAGILVHGERVALVSVRLTFGDRYYFLCPRCDRRVEALYFLGRDVGCRRCLHLGYESQVYRPGSPWRLLSRVFDRRPLHRLSRRWEDGDSPVVTEVVAPMREMMQEKVEAMLTKIDGGDDDGQVR